MHIPINIQVAGDDDTGTNAGFELPAIVPIPTENGTTRGRWQTKADTWVRLKFRSLADGSEVEVERRLERDGKKNYEASV